MKYQDQNTYNIYIYIYNDYSKSMCSDSDYTNSRTHVVGAHTLLGHLEIVRGIYIVIAAKFKL